LTVAPTPEKVAPNARQLPGGAVSDIINTLREAATNPEKAKDSLAGLTAKWSEMTEEQRTQASEALSNLAGRASQMTEEQRAQATQVLAMLKDKMVTMPDDARAQVNDLLARFTR
jgi:ABC-type transporter Mla subunit MlaD